jgi:hypothetical protein
MGIFFLAKPYACQKYPQNCMRSLEAKAPWIYGLMEECFQLIKSMEKMKKYTFVKILLQKIEMSVQGLK